MIDWIMGLKFIKIADWVYRPYGGSNPFNHIGPGDYRFIENTLDFNALRPGDIIYTHTFYASQLFERLTEPVIVISHNCDTPADIKPPEGIKWFTTNKAINDPNIIPLPFGIQDEIYYPEINKTGKMIAAFEKEKKFKNLLYIDHRIWVNPAERRRPYELFKDKSWVTTIETENTDKKLTHETINSFDRYLDNLYNHCFVISPPGNGICTCRPWEALYLGTIPVEKYNYNNICFDLPFLLVNDWNEITSEFLYQKWDHIVSNYWKYNWDQLTFTYWKNLIYENSRAYGRRRQTV